MTPLQQKRTTAPDDPPDDTGVGPGRGSAKSSPRWVAVLGIAIAIVLVLLLFVLHLTGILGPGAH